MKQEVEKQRRLTAEEHMMIVVELASGQFKQKEIAERHGISEQRVSAIKLEHEELFHRVRNSRLESITAEAVKNQEWRLTQYARDLEKMDSQWHHEAVKARTQILKNVSDELGQGVPKTQISIQGAEHILIGVDPEQDL